MAGKTVRRERADDLQGEAARHSPRLWSADLLLTQLHTGRCVLCGEEGCCLVPKHKAKIEN